MGVTMLHKVVTQTLLDNTLLTIYYIHVRVLDVCSIHQTLCRE